MSVCNADLATYCSMLSVLRLQMLVRACWHRQAHPCCSMGQANLHSNGFLSHLSGLCKR